MSTPLWAIGIVVVATVVGATASLLLKLGAHKFNLKIFDQMKNWEVILGLSLYFFSSLLYITGLKFGDLSIIYPIASVQYIWIAILSQKYLNEKMNTNKWIGITMIIIGIVLINL